VSLRFVFCDDCPFWILLVVSLVIFGFMSSVVSDCDFAFGNCVSRFAIQVEVGEGSSL